MRINRKGVTRIVFEFEDFVVKIPNFTCQWDHFLKGILANIQESKTWRYNSGKYERGLSRLLCPVLWCSWGGWFLFMRKADMVVTEDNRGGYNIDEHLEHFEGDDTISNYGVLEGRIVKVDYGQ